MLRVLGRGKQAVVQAEAPAPAKARVRSPEDSLLLLVPSEGGMAFRLFLVDNEKAAAAFLQQEFPRLGGKSIAFWPLKEKPRASAGKAAEALVLIGDPSRPGTVYLSSFESMEDAESFMRFEMENGLDPALITVYWGVPQTIAASAQMQSPVEDFTDVIAGAPQFVQPQSSAPAEPPAPRAPSRVKSPAPPVTATGVLPTAAVRATPRAQATAQQTPAAAPSEGVFVSVRRWPGWATLRERVIAAATLKWEVYEEIKKDPISSAQARVLVATGAAAAGIGAFWAGPLAIVAYAVAAVLGWLAFAYLTYWVGTTVFPGRKSEETWSLLFKALGIASAPRILMLSGLLLPLFSPLIALALFIWVLATAVPATQYSLELDRESAILSAVSGALALFAVALMLPAVII